ncbi:3'-5' exonuclease family protein [Streptomyces scabiei]|uniref:3'-5' exoribonuclease n=1 Tax=Streptomyces scabiei TaxID=1930 RepID=UPI001B32C81D|nr:MULTISPECIES: 3'-5' exoribonuclease [Streptomyces]MDX3283066.1 3'-5' exoribonuclease [Streptomyces scabiei]
MSIRNVYLDCEFLPADLDISGLVSIGLTDDQGADYYAVHADMDQAALHAIPWMVENVWPHLPLDQEPGADGLDYDDPAMQSIRDMRAGVAQYFADTDATETRLWAWYGAQDMCRLHSLWDNDWSVMPDQVPRWFNELETLRWQAGGPEMPEQPGGLHNALADARHNRAMHQFLAGLGSTQ